MLDVDEELRDMNVALLISLSCGKFGFFFSDMGLHQVDDSLCNQGDRLVERAAEVMGESVQFPSLRQTLAADMSSLGRRTRPIIYSMRIISEFEQQFLETRLREYGRTGGESAKLCSDFVEFGRKRLTEWGRTNKYEEDQYALWELMAAYRRPFIVSASVVGGLLAQEVRKFISGQLSPLPNCTAFNFNTSTATSKSIPSTQHETM
eukprot:GHVS01097838.1.p1 GENE.GHVS01097838.1~~GHVS01097838.1.p1  ORF type:complete len:206 (+),score=31.48 GHVS01097838.1:554-1171(+)